MFWEKLQSVVLLTKNLTVEILAEQRSSCSVGRAEGELHSELK